MNGNRHSSCNCFFEDFGKAELAKPCPVCFYYNTTIPGGSHPRKPLSAGNYYKYPTEKEELSFTEIFPYGIHGDNLHDRFDSARLLVTYMLGTIKYN